MKNSHFILLDVDADRGRNLISSYNSKEAIEKAILATWEDGVRCLILPRYGEVAFNHPYNVWDEEGSLINEQYEDRFFVFTPQNFARYMCYNNIWGIMASFEDIIGKDLTNKKEES